MSSISESSSFSDLSESDLSSLSESGSSSPDSINEANNPYTGSSFSKYIQISESGSLPLTPASLAGGGKHVIKPITITPRHRIVPKLQFNHNGKPISKKSGKMPEIPTRHVIMRRASHNLVPDDWTRYDKTPRKKTSESSGLSLHSHSLPMNMDSETESKTTTTYTTVFVHKPRHVKNPREISEITQEELEQLSARIRRNSETHSEIKRVNKSAITRLFDKIRSLCVRIWDVVCLFFRCFRR